MGAAGRRRTRRHADAVGKDAVASAHTPMQKMRRRGAGSGDRDFALRSCWAAAGLKGKRAEAG